MSVGSSAEGGPAPETEPLDISGVVTKVIVRFVRAKADDSGVARLLASAGERRPSAELEDPRSWSTNEQVVALLNAAAQVVGDLDIGRHIGEEMLRPHEDNDLELLWSFGSATDLFRNVGELTNFSRCSTVDSIEVVEGNATIREVTRSGTNRHWRLCEFTKGLLSQAPALFGLMPAVVTETECQARGGQCCMYHVAWEGTLAFTGDATSLTGATPDLLVGTDAAGQADAANARIAHLQDQLGRIGDQLEEVASTASELLAGGDISQLLENIMHRAAAAVGAPRFLLVARTAPDEPVQMHHHGFEPQEARLLAAELWRQDLDTADGSRLIVDIASSRRSYGRLAAVYPPGTEVGRRAQEIFSLYANYAATALDLHTSLAESERSSTTASALLDFSRALSRASTSEEVSQTLADAVPAVLGCERAAVMIWDPLHQRLVFKAVSGAPDVFGQDADDAGGAERGNGKAETVPGPADQPDFGTIESTDTPLVATLMSTRDVAVVDRDTPDPFLQSVMQRYDTQVCVMAPLHSDYEFLGVVAAIFLTPPAVDLHHDHDMHERLRALAYQAVTAFQNAWLLEQVGHLAWHDALTGLPNRRLLEDRVRQQLERAMRLNEPSSMFFVDLDRFKKVNDTLGHAAGDELIKQVAVRLGEVVSRPGIVARLGGDEFAILLPGLAGLVAVRQLAERVLEALHQPYTIEGTEVFTSASIGIAIHPEHGESYDDLLNHADEAMYRAKDLGRDTFQIYEPDPNTTIHVGIRLDSDLHYALERNELFVLYQPYIDLQSNQVVGVEALVRWRHPVQGILEPAAFIPYAEESDLIVGIDEFVIRQAARQLRLWLHQGLGPLRMSVNVSSRDLLHPGFVDTVMSALADNAVPPEQFELEITEQVALDDAGVMRWTVEELRARGVRFSIDDFGAGTSSVQQVAAFPVTTLKIDRTFVQMLGPLDELTNLTAAIVAMADELGLDCVAEGVESPHQSRVLLQRGCTTAQGFFFSPPLFPTDVQRMLQPAIDTPGRPPSRPSRRPDLTGSAPRRQSGDDHGGGRPREGARTRSPGAAPEPPSGWSRPTPRPPSETSVQPEEPKAESHPQGTVADASEKTAAPTGAVGEPR
jgi:diguanylate cyclase (GGDEF)-like protein